MPQNIQGKFNRYEFDKLQSVLRQLFVNCFTMTFIAEWGDRSQLATIVLAGMNNVWGVIVGQCLLELSTGLFTML